MFFSFIRKRVVKYKLANKESIRLFIKKLFHNIFIINFLGYLVLYFVLKYRTFDTWYVLSLSIYSALFITSLQFNLIPLFSKNKENY